MNKMTATKKLDILLRVASRLPGYDTEIPPKPSVVDLLVVAKSSQNACTRRFPNRRAKEASLTRWGKRENIVPVHDILSEGSSTTTLKNRAYRQRKP